MTQAEAEVAPEPLRRCAPQLLVVPSLVVAVRREVDGHQVGEGLPGLVRGQASPRDLSLGLRRGVVHAADQVDVGPPRLEGRSSRRCLSQLFCRSRHADRGRQRTTQKVCAKSRGGSEAAGHEADHGEADQRLGGLDPVLVVLAEAATLAEPGEGSLDDPALGQGDEATRVVRALDDLQFPAGPLTHPVDELAGVPIVGPEPLETGQLPQQGCEQQPGAVAVVDVGGVHPQAVDQSQGIDDKVALAPLNLLASVIPARPPTCLLAGRR